MANPSAEAHDKEGLTVLSASHLASTEQRSPDSPYAHELAHADPELALVVTVWPSLAAEKKRAILLIAASR